MLTCKQARQDVPPNIFLVSPGVCPTYESMMQQMFRARMNKAQSKHKRSRIEARAKETNHLRTHRLGQEDQVAMFLLLLPLSIVGVFINCATPAITNNLD